MFLNITQACKYVGCSRSTIYNWLAAGKLTRYTTPSGKKRINCDELIKKEPQPMAMRPLKSNENI